MKMEQSMEPTKQTLSNFANIVKFKEEIKESGAELVEVLKELSEKFMEIYDLELAEEMTEIYEEMVGLNKIVVLELVNSKMKCELEMSKCKMKLMELEESSDRYWNIMKKLAICEKECDEERRAREQAECDAEYYAKELAKRRQEDEG